MVNMMYGGKLYRSGGYFTTKAIAQRFAKKHRETGGLARVVKDPISSGYKVWIRGRNDPRR